MTTTRLSIVIDGLARSLAPHVTAAAAITNQIAEALLGADNETLTEYLNARPAEETLAMFGRHSAFGEALNTAGGIACEMLAAWDAPTVIPAVDVASVADKLARQRRVLAFDGATFTITDLPAPEPEPTVDIQPEPAPE